MYPSSTHYERFVCIDAALAHSNQRPFIPWVKPEKSLTRLSRRHSLSHQSLKSQLLLLKVISRRIINLKLAHGLAEGLLDLLLLSTLELER